MGGPVLMEGRGERVRRIDDGVLRELGVDSLPSPGSIEVFCPAIFSSTPDVYREFRESDRGVGPNDLQPAALRLYPGIADALRHLEEKGLTRVTMSGSGSAVYGVKSAGSGC
jgi:4-diphosphocytidyl-2-C-methyl-D-erythritol kinase